MGGEEGYKIIRGLEWIQKFKKLKKNLKFIQKSKIKILKFLKKIYSNFKATKLAKNHKSTQKHFFP